LTYVYVDEPPVARGVPAGTCRVDEQRGEPLYQPAHGHMINLDAAFRQQFFDVAVGLCIAQVPTDCHRDHFRCEPEPDEFRFRHEHTRITTTHRPSLPTPVIKHATVPVHQDQPAPAMTGPRPIT
jgi:hypothetical protein